MAGDAHQKPPESIHIPLRLGEESLIGVTRLGGMSPSGANMAGHRSFSWTENPPSVMARKECFVGAVPKAHEKFAESS